MEAQRSSGAKGRPRQFDCELALDQALRVFRDKGYEGASLADLTHAMGINRPSLYAAFGNKEALFLKVVDRYTALARGLVEEALAMPAVEEALRRILQISLSGYDEGDGQGCLLVQAALSGSDEVRAIRRELAKRRAASEDMLRRRLERAQADGELPLAADAAALAKYFAIVQNGLAVQMNAGADRARLLSSIELALEVLRA